MLITLSEPSFPIFQTDASTDETKAMNRNEMDIDAVNSSEMNKSEYRQILLKQRQGLPKDDWRDRSQALCQRLQTLPQFQTAQTVFAYFSIRQEPDLGWLWRSHPEKTWVFPRCIWGEAGENQLRWHQWQPEIPLDRGAYGILEPIASAPEVLPQQADLILVPAVGCDRHCNRLGYGGGFYDRTLSQPGMEAVLKIGIVFELALLETLPQDSWDQPLEAICTEQRFLQRSSSCN